MADQSSTLRQSPDATGLVAHELGGRLVYAHRQVTETDPMALKSGSLSSFHGTSWRGEGGADGRHVRFLDLALGLSTKFGHFTMALNLVK